MRLALGSLDSLLAPVTAFLSWWGGELRAMVPRRWRGGGHGGVLLRLDESGSWPAVDQRGPVTVLLPESWVWRKRLRLPAVTAGTLDDVLRYELDRETPFAPAQVRFAGTVLRREGAEILVEVTLVPRRLADPALAALGDAGLVVGRLAPQDSPPGLQLLDAGEIPRSGAGRTLWPLALALAVLALALIPLAESWQRDLLDARLESARLQAGAAARIESQLSGAAGRDDPLRLRRQAVPSVSEILARLTDALPDETYVEQVRLSGREIQLLGWSATADELPARLERIGPFRDVRFLSAVVRDSNKNRDRFSMGLQLVIGEGGK